MQPSYDEEHLRLAAIFHYPVALLAAIVAFFPGFFWLLVAFFSPEMQEGMPAWAVWGAVAIVVVVIGLGLILAWAMIKAGRALEKRQNLRYCRRIALIQCLFVPFGTVLGLFTLYMLSKSVIIELFEEVDGRA